MFIFKSIISINKNIIYIIVIAINCILSAVYTFNLVNKILFNKESLYLNNKRDILKNDFVVISIFLFLVIFFGICESLYENIIFISKSYSV